MCVSSDKSREHLPITKRLLILVFFFSVSNEADVSVSDAPTHASSQTSTCMKVGIATSFCLCDCPIIRKESQERAADWSHQLVALLYLPKVGEGIFRGGDFRQRYQSKAVAGRARLMKVEPISRIMIGLTMVASLMQQSLIFSAEERS